MNTPFIKLSLFFAAGILAGTYWSVSLDILYLFLGVAFLLFALAFLRAKKLFLEDILFGGSSFLMIFLLGIICSNLHRPEQQERHYLNHLSIQESQQERLATVTIREQLKSDLYNDKFIGEVSSLNGKKAKGKLLLLFPKEERHSISVDDRLLVSSKFTAFSPPLNPHQFDYRKLMNNRGIYRQVVLQDHNYCRLDSNNSTIKGKAHQLRRLISTKLEAHGFEKEELAIIQALLLGQRHDISIEVYENYAAAGVIHILAVSGLHVGIILVLLNWALSPLRFFGYGVFLRFLLLLVFLWGFAVLAGLSPSVVRAVTMFSFVGLGMQLKRRTNIMNTLFISFFLLLLIRPQHLFEVGFQLSYIAVLSIILFQPMLSRLWWPRNRAAKYFWDISTVTVAAQVGVFPLSLYYFHQFPGLFFLSNLAILPFLGFVLISGLGILMLALLDFLPNILVEAYTEAIAIINRVVAWIAEQEIFLFEGIPFSWFQTLATYLFLFALFHFVKRKDKNHLVFLLGCVLLVQGSFIFEQYQTRSRELVVFHKYKGTVLGEKYSENLKLSHGLDALPEDLSLIRNYVIGERIDQIETAGLSNIYFPGEAYLLAVDSSGIYQIPAFDPRYVLLINSPKINLERMLQEIQPQQIIADGSNYPSYVDRWRKTSAERGIPFHTTAELGAYKITPKKKKGRGWWKKKVSTRKDQNFIGLE